MNNLGAAASGIALKPLEANILKLIIRFLPRVFTADLGLFGIISSAEKMISYMTHTRQKSAPRNSKSDDFHGNAPDHSPVALLLEYIGVKTVILAGITTNACVMIAASDVYIRDYRLFVPSDCGAALTAKEQRNALKLIKKNFEATTTPSERLDLSRLLAPSLESSAHPTR